LKSKYIQLFKNLLDINIDILIKIILKAVNMLGLNVLSLKQARIQEAFPEVSRELTSSASMNFMDMLSSKISKNEDEEAFKKGAESLNSTAIQNISDTAYNASDFDEVSDKRDISKDDETGPDENDYDDEKTKIQNAGMLFNFSDTNNKAEINAGDFNQEVEKNILNKLEKKVQSHELNTNELNKQGNPADINKNISEDNRINFTAEKAVLKKIDKFEVNNDSKKNDQAQLFEKINSLLNVLQNAQKQNLNSDINAFLKEVKDFFRPGSAGKDFEKLKKALSQLETAADKMSDMKMLDKVLIKNLTSFVSDVIEKTKGRNFKNEIRNSEKNSASTELFFRTAEISELPKKSVTMKSSSDDAMSSMNTLLEKNSGSVKKALAAAQTPKSREAFMEQLQQIIDKAKITVHDSKNGSFIFRLNPKELGSVNVNIGLEQGIVKGKFLVETNEAKELLIQNLDFVKTQLEESGISVGEFQVNVKEQGKPYDNNEKRNDIRVHSGPGSVKNEEYEYTAAVPQHNGSVNMII